MTQSKGFTLIELLIVIAIIGILAAVAIPQYKNYTRKSKALEARVMLGAIRTNQEQFFSENDSYAGNLSSLGNPTANAKYFSFSMDVAANSFTATASPNTTAASAGLTGTWTLDNTGSFNGNAITSGNFY